MIARKVPAADIPESWDWLAVVLSPALEQDAVFTPDEVFGRLCAGDMAALVFEGEAEGVAVYAIADGPDGPVLFIPYVTGRIEGGPRRRLATMRAIERAFCSEAQRLGCIEIRADGRNWHRLLPGWERTDFGLRKVI